MALSYVNPVQHLKISKTGKYIIEYTRYTNGGLCIEVVSTQNIIWQNIKICFDVVCIKKEFPLKILLNFAIFQLKEEAIACFIVFLLILVCEGRNHFRRNAKFQVYCGCSLSCSVIFNLESIHCEPEYDDFVTTVLFCGYYQSD